MLLLCAELCVEIRTDIRIQNNSIGQALKLLSLKKTIIKLRIENGIFIRDIF